MNESTAANIKRKAVFVDVAQLDTSGRPLPSWIDINVTELCNRSAGSRKACGFCPRIDPIFYPNQGLHMGLDLAGRIADDLRALGYRGAIVLCGFGEPLLHPRIVSLATLFYGLRVEIVTNGDRLHAEMISELARAGVHEFAFIGGSLRLRGADAAPLRPIALPLRPGAGRRNMEGR